MSSQIAPTAPLETVRRDEAPTFAAHSASRSFSAAPNAEQALFRVDLLRSLRLHYRLALSIFVVGIVLAAVNFLRSWPTYSAESLIYVQPFPGKVIDNVQQRFPTDNVSYTLYLQQEMANATRIDVLTAALHKLKPGVFQGKNESDQAAADRLSHIIEATQAGSYQFTISASARKPEVAAAIANAVTASFMDNAAREQTSGDPERLSILRAERDRVQSELQADQAEQQAINQQLGVAIVGTGAPDLLDDDIARAREALAKARIDHDEAEAKFNALDAGAATDSPALDAAASDVTAVDPGLVSMKSTLYQRRASLITLMANLSPNHPEYKQDAAELAKINSSLDSISNELRTKAAQNLQEKLRTELEQTSGVEDKLNAQLRQLVSTTGATTTKMQRSSDLGVDITRLQARYTSVDEQIHNLMLEDGAPGAVSVTAAAVPPLHPGKSGALKIAVVIVLFSLVLGVASAIGAHKLDGRLYIASDVEQVLGVAPMAQWPEFAEVPDAVANEHVLRLASALDYTHKQGGFNSCMFTGASAGAGTSTVALKVSNMLEALGQPTMLVDTTNFQPVLEAPAHGDPDAQSSTLRPGRSLVQLRQIADEARTKDQSLFIADSAPLAVSAEAEHLARSVDSAIVVIESGVTTRQQLKAAADTLRRLDVGAVGFVLNRISLSKADDAFKHSLKDMEEHLRYQRTASDNHSIGNRHLAALSAEPAAPAAEETTHAQPEPTSEQFAAPAAFSPIPLEAPAPAELASLGAAPAVPVEEPTLSESPVLSAAEPVPVEAPAPAEVAALIAEPPVPVEVPVLAELADLSTAPPVPVETPTIAESAAPSPALPSLAASAVPQTTVSEQVAAPSPSARPGINLPFSRPSRESAAASKPDVPWWLTEMAPDNADLAASSKSSPSAPRSQDFEMAPVKLRKETEAAFRAREAEEAATKAREAETAAARKLEAELLAARQREIALLAEQMRRSQSIESQRAAEARLTGLRSALLSLGLNHLNQGRGAVAPAEPNLPQQPLPRQAQEPVAVYAQPQVQRSNPEATREVARVITAAPEFLPPQDESSRQDRRDRRDTFDEVDVLPSWHGQYKRKS